MFPACRGFIEKRGDVKCILRKIQSIVIFGAGNYEFRCGELWMWLLLIRYGLRVYIAKSPEKLL